MKNTVLAALVVLGAFCLFTCANQTFAAQTSSSNSTSSAKATKAQLDKLAMSALKAAEKRDNNEMRSYLYQMMQKGVTSMSAPEIVAKRTPNCPPIKMELNGRKLSGSVCARMVYDYDGKENWVGYCK